MLSPFVHFSVSFAAGDGTWRQAHLRYFLFFLNYLHFWIILCCCFEEHAQARQEKASCESSNKMTQHVLTGPNLYTVKLCGHDFSVPFLYQKLPTELSQSI